MSSLNPETIAALKALDDGDGFFADMVNTFLTNAQVTFEHLQTAQTANDLCALERAAHKLRGAASTIGAQNLVAICEALEKSAREGHVPDVVGAVAAIETELQHVRLALQAEMHN